MDLTHIDWNQGAKELAEATSVFEERLNACGFVHGHLWMFALHDVLYDLPGVFAKLAAVYTASDPVGQTPKLLDDFESYVLYGFLPHVEYHFANTDDPQLAMLLPCPGSTAIPAGALERRSTGDRAASDSMSLSLATVTYEVDALLAVSEEFTHQMTQAGLTSSNEWFAHVQSVLHDLRQMMTDLVAIFLISDPCNNAPQMLQTYVLNVLNQLVPRMKQRMEALESQLDPMLTTEDHADQDTSDTVQQDV